MPRREFFQRSREAIELLHALTIIEQCSWSETVNTLQRTRTHWGHAPDQATSFEPLDSLKITCDVSALRNVDILSAFFFAFDESSVHLQLR